MIKINTKIINLKENGQIICLDIIDESKEPLIGFC